MLCNIFMNMILDNHLPKNVKSFCENIISWTVPRWRNKPLPVSVKEPEGGKNPFAIFSWGEALSAEEAEDSTRLQFYWTIRPRSCFGQVLLGLTKSPFFSDSWTVSPKRHTHVVFQNPRMGDKDFQRNWAINRQI